MGGVLIGIAPTETDHLHLVAESFCKSGCHYSLDNIGFDLPEEAEGTSCGDGVTGAL